MCNRKYICFFLLFLIKLTLVSAQKKEIKPILNSKIYTIENCVNSFDPNNIDSTKVGYQYWFIDKDFIDGRTLKLSVVAPHEATHAPHKHAEDEFFFVLEGKAEFYFNGMTTTGGAYTSFYCPSWQEHGIRNIGDTQLKYLVIKKYQINESR